MRRRNFVAFAARAKARRFLTRNADAKLTDAVSARIELQTARRPGTSDREINEVASGRKSASNPAGRDRFGQDLHRGQCYLRNRSANSGHVPQQNVSSSALLRV